MPFVFRIYVAYAPWCLSLELLLFLLSIIGIIWHTCIQDFNISKRAFNWHIYLKIDPTLILLALKKILFRAFASCSTRSRCIQWVSYLYFLGPFYLLLSHQPFTIHHVPSLKSSSHLPSSFYYVRLYQRDFLFFTLEFWCWLLSFSG